MINVSSLHPFGGASVGIHTLSTSMIGFLLHTGPWNKKLGNQCEQERIKTSVLSLLGRIHLVRTLKPESQTEWVLPETLSPLLLYILYTPPMCSQDGVRDLITARCRNLSFGLEHLDASYTMARVCFLKRGYKIKCSSSTASGSRYWSTITANKLEITFLDRRGEGYFVTERKQSKKMACPSRQPTQIPERAWIEKSS